MCRCLKPDTKTMMLCHHCKTKCHLLCENIRRIDIGLIDTYYCKLCRESYGDLIRYKNQRTATAEEVEAKRRENYVVERIVSHKIDNDGNRFFTLKWENYPSSDNTEEPEENLDDALNMLQEYCTKKGLKPSKIEGRVGASSTLKVNRQNWITLNQIEQGIAQQRNRLAYRSEIKVVKWNGHKKEDCIHLLTTNNHCFCLLYIHGSNIYYVADGSNYFLRDNSIRESISEIIESEPIGIPFNQQTKMDYCGASAVLITLELIRAHKMKVIPPQLEAPPALAQRIYSLHRHKSQPIVKRTHNLIMGARKCDHCGKAFKQSNIKSLKNHQAICNRSINNLTSR